MYEFAVTPAVTQLRRPGVTIDSIEPDGLANDLGLEAGDRIVKVNGRPVRDYLDFRFQTSGETLLTFIVKKKNRETWEVDLERGEGEDFGINFEQIVPRQCANECLFCFCKGNPEDARPSLFVRDEDIRLSFLYGNYTTLSSITEDEMSRIIEQRLSPQYVSVHATDLKTRAYLLGVDESRADISEKLERLLKNNIEIHAQVVLCPGINDGKQLEKTLRDLGSHYPKVISTAIVPVALTRYNKDERLNRVTSEFCRRTIDEVGKLQEEFRKELGETFAFLGDEIYLKAGADIPSKEHYGNYPQIEDGVGMIRTFTVEFEAFLREVAKERVSRKVKGAPRARQGANIRTNDLAIKPVESESRISDFRLRHLGALKNGSGGVPDLNTVEGTIFTGQMFAPVLTGQVNKLNKLVGSKLHVVGVPNTYFGGDVAVAGLLSGKDFIAVEDRVEGDFVIIPESVVKSDEPILIDGMQVDAMQEAFSVPVYAMNLTDFLGIFR